MTEAPESRLSPSSSVQNIIGSSMGPSGEAEVNNDFASMKSTKSGERRVDRRGQRRVSARQCGDFITSEPQGYETQLTTPGLQYVVLHTVEQQSTLALICRFQPAKLAAQPPQFTYLTFARIEGVSAGLKNDELFGCDICDHQTQLCITRPFGRGSCIALLVLGLSRKS